MLYDDRDHEQIRIIVKYAEKAFRQCKVGDCSFAQFSQDEVLQDLAAFFLIQIGEAVGRLSEEYKEGHSSVNWRGMYGLRCYLVHGYDNANQEIVWQSLTEDLPVVYAFCLDELK